MPGIDMETTAGGGAPQRVSDPAKALPLDILICTFGTRGDTLPYIRVAQTFMSHGHRVRLCVSPSLEGLVRDDYGLETYSTGYDMELFLAFGTASPRRKALMMVNGEFKKLKSCQTEMIAAYWRASIDDGPRNPGQRPFVADAILAPLPSMLHVSLAQRLNVPLFIVQFNPRSPTRAWPASSRNPTSTILEPCDENLASWQETDTTLWKRYYRGIINKIRKRDLGLPPLGSKHWPGEFWDLNVPIANMVSQHVLPRPDDFSENNRFLNYIFTEQPKAFDPPMALMEFLDGHGPLVYVDFSSNIHHDKERLTLTILEAVDALKLKAIFRRRWFASSCSVPDNVLVIDEVPHSWLFPRVDVILHSCGAGTTAMALKTGTPSAPVPIRGDQYLWAKRLTQLDTAPEGVYMRDLTAENLRVMLKEALRTKYRTGAKVIAEALAREPDGSTSLFNMWHQHMIESEGYPEACSVLPHRNAVWSLGGQPAVRLSGLAAHVLVSGGVLSYSQLDLIRVREWDKHASLKPPRAPRNPSTDVIRQRRIDQGAYDSANLEKDGLNKFAENDNSTDGHKSGRLDGLRVDTSTKSILMAWERLAVPLPKER